MLHDGQRSMELQLFWKTCVPAVTGALPIPQVQRKPLILLG